VHRRDAGESAQPKATSIECGYAFDEIGLGLRELTSITAMHPPIAKPIAESMELVSMKRSSRGKPPRRADKAPSVNEFSTRLTRRSTSSTPHRGAVRNLKSDRRKRAGGNSPNLVRRVKV